MATQDKDKEIKGRKYEQLTRDGTGSAASMGMGGTGARGAGSGQDSQQSASRTDDLLAGASCDQEAEQAFSGGSKSGEVRTGMEGIVNRGGNASGNRQQAPGEQRADPGRERDPATRKP
ncbi:MAG: hypothetical protein ACREWI_18790 [Telluria sp.]